MTVHLGRNAAEHLLGLDTWVVRQRGAEEGVVLGGDFDPGHARERTSPRLFVAARLPPAYSRSTPSTMKRPIAVMTLPRRHVISWEQKFAAAVASEFVERVTSLVRTSTIRTETARLVSKSGESAWSW